MHFVCPIVNPNKYTNPHILIYDKSNNKDGQYQNYDVKWKSILVNSQVSPVFTPVVQVLYAYETALVIIMQVYALNYNGARSLAWTLLATELYKHVIHQFFFAY